MVLTIFFSPRGGHHSEHECTCFFILLLISAYQTFRIMSMRKVKHRHAFASLYVYLSKTHTNSRLHYLLLKYIMFYSLAAHLDSVKAWHSTCLDRLFSFVLYIWTLPCMLRYIPYFLGTTFISLVARIEWEASSFSFSIQ